MSKKTYTHNGYYGYINKVQEKALSNPQWFWSNDEDATKARQWLHDNHASAIVDEIYDNTPDDIKKNIDYKKLSQNSRIKHIKSSVNDTRNDFANKAATQLGYVSAVPAIAYGLAVAPAMTALGAASGLPGALIGGIVGSNFDKKYINSDGTPIVSTYANEGAFAGATIASVAGGIGGSKIDKRLTLPKKWSDALDNITWNNQKQDAWRENYHKQKDVENAYDRFVNDGIIESNADDWYGHDNLGVLSDGDIRLDDFELDFFRNMLSKPEANRYGFVDAAKNLGIDSHTSLDEFNNILNNAYRRSDPNYKHLNLLFNWDRSYRKPRPFPAAKPAVVDQVRQALDGIRFVRNNQKSSPAPPTKLTMKGNLFDSRSNNYGDVNHVTIGFTPPRKHITVPKSEYRLTIGGMAAHEAGHGNPLFNTYASPGSVTPDSPYYGNDYSRVSNRIKQLLEPTDMTIDNHDMEFTEGYSDLWGMKYNMRNIKGNSDRKYNYLDLLRYKLTPVGRKDRFVMQRGGWWKGWKQQLDALNEVYKNGGKIHAKK